MTLGTRGIAMGSRIIGWKISIRTKGICAEDLTAQGTAIYRR